MAKRQDFDSWWNEEGQHFPQNNLELAESAWDAAIDAAAECVVPDGNPEVALDRIRMLKT